MTGQTGQTGQTGHHFIDIGMEWCCGSGVNECLLSITNFTTKVTIIIPIAIAITIIIGVGVGVGVGVSVSGRCRGHPSICFLYLRET